MGMGYRLINIDKQEQINFSYVNTGTKLRELSGTIIASNIVTYYILKNTGNRIGFINDTDSFFELFGERYISDFFSNFTDVTNKIIEELIDMEIIEDNGIIWIDQNENLFYKDLNNIWDPKLTLK